MCSSDLLNDGLATSADFEVFGVTGQFSGRVESRDAGPKALGRLAVLIENTDQLFSVFGLSPRDGSPIGKVFSGEGVVEVSPQVFDLKEIRGTVAGTSFKGSVNLAFDNEQPVLKLAMESGRLSVPFVLGAALLRRDGKRQTAATRFSREAMVGVKADVTVKTRNLQFWPGFDAQEASLSLTADGGAIKLDRKSVV